MFVSLSAVSLGVQFVAASTKLGAGLATLALDVSQFTAVLRGGAGGLQGPTG